MPDVVDMDAFTLNVITRSRLLCDKLQLTRRLFKGGNAERANETLKQTHTLAVMLALDIETLTKWGEK